MADRATQKYLVKGGLPQDGKSDSLSPASSLLYFTPEPHTQRFFHIMTGIFWRRPAGSLVDGNEERDLGRSIDTRSIGDKINGPGSVPRRWGSRVVETSQDLEAKGSFCNDYSSDQNCWELWKNMDSMSIR